MKEIMRGTAFTNLAEISCVAWRTLAFKVIPVPDACAAVFAWIRVTHCNCGEEYSGA